MFEEDFADFWIFRGGLPYYHLLITLPILIIICSSNPVLASSEFGVQRMSQYDIHGMNYGCRASALNLEAKSLYTWSTGRHCIVTRFQDMTIDQFREIRANAGGLVILMPGDISPLNDSDKEHLCLLEQAMMAQVSPIPIYFAQHDTELQKVIEDITNTADDSKNPSNVRESALSELMNSISANGYQIVVSGASHSPSKQSKIPIIQGELVPHKFIKTSDGDANSKMPFIVIVAHLNTFGLYNEYTSNTDIAVFMTLIDLFSKLYDAENTVPNYKLMFLLSESGSLLNFQGMKKWLEDNTQIQTVDFVLCLDTISHPFGTKIDTLLMHVSKPPKEGTPMSNFYKHLRRTAAKYENVTVEGVHKKINLADVLLAWEHERFSMKRLPAFTLSTLRTHKDPVRTTTFKGNQEDILISTQKSAKILAEALAGYIYNVDDGEIFSGVHDVTTNTIKPWMEAKSTFHNNDLKITFEKFLKNVKITYDKPDQRDPDFMLYEGQDADLFVYRVKPAVFDLFLTLAISAYLGSFYLIVQYFPHIYSFVCKMSKDPLKVKSY